MGWIYDGPYDIGAARHEGYLDDSRTGRYVAACRCGWRGGEAPMDERGESEARIDWELHHLYQLIADAAGVWPAWADRVARLAAMVAADVETGRHLTAHSTLKRLTALTVNGQRMVAGLAWPQPLPSAGGRRWRWPGSRRPGPGKVVR